MAKFVPSFGEFSGKVGAVVFSHNRYCSYVRRWVVPANPRTQSQLQRRDQLSFCADYWVTSLLPSERLAWDGFAGGAPDPLRGNLSGQAWFCRIGCNRLQAGLPVATMPPSLWSGHDLMTLNYLPVNPPFSLSFSPAPLPAACHLVIDATPCLKWSQIYDRPFFRLITISPGGQASPISVFADWQARFGELPATPGWRISMRAHILDCAPASLGYAGAVLRVSYAQLPE